MDEVQTRECARCHVVKPLDKFVACKSKPLGRKYHCKACQAKESLRRDPEKRMRSYVKAKYGITLDQYKALLDQPCEICGKTDDMHLDHDHVTGQIRGALCHNCNVGIGHFNDDPARLRAAAEYIEKSRTPFDVRPVQ